MAPLYKKALARGFSLLEVLVAVVILSVGLLALASLQMSVIRASAATKTQTLAANLAKEKIEEMRSFTTLDQYRLRTSAAAPGTVETLNDSGGNQGGVNFTRTTLVQRYVYNKLAATPGFVTVGNTLTDAQLTALKDASHDYLIGKDFKRLSVTVGWVDAVGQAQTLTLEDIMDSLDPTESAKMVKASSGGTGPRTLEQIIKDPALDNMVIPIALGGGVDSAATNPKPTVVVGTNVVETRFDVLTYAGVNGGTATAQQKVETVVVGCTCTLDSPPASTVRGMRPTYWNGFRYATPVEVAASGSESYSPPAKADPGSAASQSAFCDTCCRDHHDPVGVKGPTFSPRRVSKNSSDVVVAGTPSHTHHLDKNTATAASSGTYKEACRLIRVDGFWRVAADLQNDYFGLLATGDGLTAPSYAPDVTSVDGSPPVVGATARYQNFVLGYMDARFVTPTPATGAEQATYNTAGTPSTLANGTTYELDKPNSILIDNTSTGTPTCTVITGITKANPAVVTHSATYTNCAAGAGVPFVNGDKVYIKNVAGMTAINNPGYFYTVANATATTFELQGVSTVGATYGAYTSGGVVENSHGKWLHSRGVYVDYLEKEATDMITAAKADPNCTVDLAAKQLCILKLLPFTSINLTEIADWDSADTSKAIVVNNNYSQTLTSLEPVRGEVSFAGGSDGQTVAINTKSRKYNSGLLDLSFDAISPFDNTLTTVPQTFEIDAAPVSDRPGGGTFYVTWAGITVPGSAAVDYVTGTQGSKSCNYVAPRFSCNVNNQTSTASPWLDSETAGLGVANSMGIIVKGYNSQGTATSTASIANCTGPYGNKTYVSVTSGTPSGRSDPANYTVKTCTVRDVTAALNSTTGVLANGPAPYNAAPYNVVGNNTQAETTQIKFPSIAADPNLLDTTYVDNLQITFNAGTTTTMTASPAAGGVCTYTCTSLNGAGTNCASVSQTKFVITSAPCP